MDVDICSKDSPGIDIQFEKCLERQCATLGIDLNLRSPSNMSARRMEVVFANAGSTWTEAENVRFERLLAEGVRVLPVIPDAPSAKSLPSALGHVNAFVRSLFGAAWPEALADEVLSMMWLHRRTPKVFISYKRTDSAPIASQLFDRLNHLGYEVFLDEASVQRGAEFQRELMWWLNDADLLIVLASPRFPKSEWCMKEVAFCQQRFIGIALVEWPSQIYEGQPRLRFPDVDDTTGRPVIAKAATADQIVTLEAPEFDGDVPVLAGPVDPKLPERKLRSEALDRVVALCARQRTVGIRQRLDNLIPLAQRVLQGATAIPGSQSPGDLAITSAAGVSSFVRVLPFRPEPENIRQACVDGVSHGISGCFYAENDPQDSRAEALRWLASGKRPPRPDLSEGRVWACWGDQIL